MELAVNAFRFYFCGSCGAMSIKNFAETHCAVCRVIDKCKMVEVRGEHEGALIVTETKAPYENEE
jgi:hypothetical protein